MDASSLSQRKHTPPLEPSPEAIALSSNLSKNTTPHSDDASEPAERTTRTPQVPPALLLLALTVLLGTIYSLRLYSSDETLFRSRFPGAGSHHPVANLLVPPDKLPSRNNPFGLVWWQDKTNPFNAYLVKFSWFWTTTAFIALVLSKAITDPKGFGVRGSAYGRAYAVATAVWYFMTQKLPLLGPSIFDRIIVATGGECVPSSLSSASITIPSEEGQTSTSILDPHHCYSYSRRAWRKHHAANLGGSRPYWNGGLDVSGHAFLLTLSILFLLSALEVTKPSATSNGNGVARRRRENEWIRTAAWTLIGIWWWMLWITSVNFHSPAEKVLGMLVGMAAWGVSWGTVR
ncbi:hypothetical protein BT69DRAFT_1299187 [Atractiella rhizophila]|nr:hypothetical protein BT69DRAFT_1299187 [Atractiella rhizophila]